MSSGRGPASSRLRASTCSSTLRPPQGPGASSKHVWTRHRRSSGAQHASASPPAHAGIGIVFRTTRVGIDTASSSLSCSLNVARVSQHHLPHTLVSSATPTPLSIIMVYRARWHLHGKVSRRGPRTTTFTPSASPDASVAKLFKEGCCLAEAVRPCKCPASFLLRLRAPCAQCDLSSTGSDTVWAGNLWGLVNVVLV